MQKVEEKESIVFEIEGQKLFAVLHRPLNCEKAPAVLMCHGLAGNKTGRFRLYVHLAKELAKAGIASFRVDFRGCGDSDGEFSEATVQKFHKDANESFRRLIHHPGIDSSRIGIFGRSFGAALAIMTAFEHKNVKSLALWAPLFNTIQWREKWHYFNDASTPTHIREQMLSVDGQQGSVEFFEEFFKIDLGPKLDGLQNVPLLHIHGVKDQTIDIHHADLYEQMRNHALAATKFIRLPNADHDFANRQDQLKAIRETTEWFKQTL